MKLYRLKTDELLEPFGDPAGEALVAGVTLERAMEATAAGCGVGAAELSSAPPEGMGEGLIAPDYFFCTRAALREFLSAAGSGEGVWRLWLKSGPLVEYLRPPGEQDKNKGVLALDLFLVRGRKLPPASDRTNLLAWLSGQAEPVVIDPGGWTESVTLSRPGPPRLKLQLPRTTVLAAHVRHWVDLLWLNQLLCRVRLQEHWEARGKTLPPEPGPRCWRRLARLNVIGEGCDVHPSAYVEGSILGRRVRLGPGAMVRESILGDGVEVSDSSRFFRCVVGEGCHTLNDSYFSCSTFYPDSTLASFLLRNSVIGRRVFLTSGVMFWDEPLTGTVRVRQRGREVDTGRYMLGGCAGHRCLLGTRAIFLPGRAVPNDTIIVMRPEEGVVKLPASVTPGLPHVYEGGEIRALAEALPAYRPPELE